MANGLYVNGVGATVGFEATIDTGASTVCHSSHFLTSLGGQYLLFLDYRCGVPSCEFLRCELRHNGGQMQIMDTGN